MYNEKASQNYVKGWSVENLRKMAKHALDLNIPPEEVGNIIIHPSDDELKVTHHFGEEINESTLTAIMMHRLDVYAQKHGLTSRTRESTA